MKLFDEEEHYISELVQKHDAIAFFTYTLVDLGLVKDKMVAWNFMDGLERIFDVEELPK